MKGELFDTLKAEMNVYFAAGNHWCERGAICLTETVSHYRFLGDTL